MFLIVTRKLSLFSQDPSTDQKVYCCCSISTLFLLEVHIGSWYVANTQKAQYHRWDPRLNCSISRNNCFPEDYLINCVFYFFSNLVIIEVLDAKSIWPGSSFGFEKETRMKCTFRNVTMYNRSMCEISFFNQVARSFDKIIMDVEWNDSASITNHLNDI